jgi:uncharacterized protein YdcH (DUF465 family)
MVTCYLTGTKFDSAQGFVLNRRWVREQINALNEQSARFERLMAQFGPLDKVSHAAGAKVHYQHRLVCQAAVQALSSGMADAKLFITWKEYQGQLQKYQGNDKKRQHPQPKDQHAQ